MICYIKINIRYGSEFNLGSLCFSVQMLIEFFSNIYECIGIVGEDRLPGISAFPFPLRRIEDGPIPGRPFLVFDPCPFDPVSGTVWGFLAQAAASIAYIDPVNLMREAGGGYHATLSGITMLRRYDALLTGQPAAGEVESQLRRILGPAIPPVHPVPMTARSTVERMSGRPVPGLDGGRILLLVGFDETQAFEASFLSAIGQIEVRHGTPIVAVIVVGDSLPETPRQAPSATPVHVTTHRLANPEPEEWAWLLDQAAAVVVPAATPDHLVAAAEAAARGRRLILQGPPGPWVETQIAGPNMPIPDIQSADLADAAVLAACLRTALNTAQSAPPTPMTGSGAAERTPAVLMKTVERILQRPTAQPTGTDAEVRELELATYLGSDPAIDALVGGIERGLPDTVRLTVYTPDGESRAGLGPATSIRPFSAYTAFGRHSRVLCAMSATTVPDLSSTSPWRCAPACCCGTAICSITGAAVWKSRNSTHSSTASAAGWSTLRPSTPGNTIPCRSPAASWNRSPMAPPGSWCTAWTSPGACRPNCIGRSPAFQPCHPSAWKRKN
ncbi:hypothetical protein ABMY26_35875 (plasmid) [Azospirillum sp. HJ39]|uniref:hypothetical protein n=1 Tax=Azospirillum sp. HJ39 TaxID=3159496 RepID=UPI0035589AE7